MMSDLSIRVRGLSKQYLIGRSRPSYLTLRDQISDGVRALLRRGEAAPSKEDVIWALNDISFDVRRGEVMGVIGRNGAGKSTLLKVLSRITAPTKGSAEIYGRVGSLLEVGTGFHGELSGRENIYLSGAILGMSRAEIDRKFDEIVAFAGVEKFIDTPVKRYSSGMYTRLAFAVAAHLEPEILIVDEVLAVGDLEFQRKCLRKMEGVAHSGRTVLFVSHNMAAMSNLCTSALWLEKGTVMATGPTNEVIQTYMKAFGDLTAEYRAKVLPDQNMRLIRVAVTDLNGDVRSEVGWHEPITILIEYELRTSLQRALVGVTLRTSDDITVFTSADYDSQPELLESRAPGRYATRLQIPAQLLRPNRYRVIVELNQVAPTVVYDGGERVSFTVVDTGTPSAKYGTANRSGVLLPLLPWSVEFVEGDKP